MSNQTHMFGDLEVIVLEWQHILRKVQPVNGGTPFWVAKSKLGV